MTGDQKNTDHIAKGQHLNRHADQRYVSYFFPIAQKKMKFCRHRIGTFESRIGRHTNPSLQKSQFSYPPHHDNDRFKGEKSYLDRQKIELN